MVSLEVVPENQTVLVGDTVSIKCTTKIRHPVDWHFIRDDAKSELYSNGQLSPRYKSEYAIHNMDNYTYILVVQEAKESQSGRYICIDNEGLGPETTTSVLEVVPKESSSVLEIGIWLTHLNTMHV